MPVPNVCMPAKKGEESAIITASPHRRNIIQSKRSEKTKKPKPGKKDKKKPKAKHRLAFEEWKCYVCSGLWSNAKEGEQWVKCVPCLTWCHEECCTFLLQVILIQNSKSNIPFANIKKIRLIS